MSRKFGLSRRDFLRVSSYAAAGVVAIACVPAEAPTVVEEVADVDPARRAEFTMGTVPMETTGTFVQGGWGPGSVAVQDQNHAWFAEFYPNMEFQPAPEGGWSAYWETIVVLLASGEHPDSAMIHFTRTAPFADKGFMLAIDDYIDALPPIDWPDDFHFTAVDNIAYKGKQYGFPIDWAPRAILINRDIMDPIMGDWPPPDNWTYQDVLNLAIEATDTSGDDKTYGLATGHWAIRQWNVTRGFGGHFFNEDITQANMLEPETIEAFQFTLRRPAHARRLPVCGRPGTLRRSVLRLCGRQHRHVVDALRRDPRLGGGGRRQLPHGDWSRADRPQRPFWL